MSTEDFSYDNLEDIVSEADELLSEGKYTDAISIFESLAENDIEKGFAYFKIAICYKNMGNIDKAMEYYNKAISVTEPDNEDFKIAKGLFLQSMNRHEDAIASFIEAIKDSTYPSYIYGLIALEYVELNDLENADKYYQNAIDVCDDSESSIICLCARGDFLTKYGKREEALSCYNNALDMAGDSAAYVLYKIANYYSENEDYKTSVEYYDKAIEAAPDSFLYYQGKGECLFNLERYNEAEDMYQKAFELSGNEDLYDAIAYCFYMAGDYTNALKHYQLELQYIENQIQSVDSLHSKKEDTEYFTDIDETAETDFDDNTAKNDYDEITEQTKSLQKQVYLSNKKTVYLMMASCYEKLNESFNSMRMYDEVLEIEPDNFDAIYAKAECYRNQKCYNAALERYFSLPSTDDDTKLAVLTNIAFCYDEMKQHETALTYYEKVLEIEPENSVAVFNKATCLFEIGKYDKAIQFVNESINLGFNKKVEAYRIITYCNICENNYAEAIEYCDKILTIEPDNIEALLNKGDCYAHMERIDDAMYYLQKVLDSDINDRNRAYILMGDCYAYNDDYKTAGEYYNNAINEILSHNDVSDSLTVSDDYKKGLSYAYYSKGNCLIECNQSPDESLICFMRAMEYGYDQYECEQKIKDIKRRWD